MRLRLGKLPFGLLIIVAAIIGGVVYVMNERAAPPNVPPAPAQVQQSDAPETIANETNNDSADITAPQQVQQAQIGNARRSTVPPDTTVFIPKAGVNSRVITAYLSGNTWDVSQIRANVGHLQGTAWLGQSSNVVLSGHVERADGSPGVFANLDQVAVNDIIQVTMGEERRVFIVTDIRTTTPDDLTPIMPTDDERLTLITCGDYDFFQDAYLERLIVVAEPV